jgi:hypothetical protein
MKSTKNTNQRSGSTGGVRGEVRRTGADGMGETGRQSELTMRAAVMS